MEAWNQAWATEDGREAWIQPEPFVEELFSGCNGRGCGASSIWGTDDYHWHILARLRPRATNPIWVG